MNIILIGFMGSGKSSVAQELAQKLKYKIIETDKLVLIKSGRNSIKEIFEIDGEMRFRELELGVARGLRTEKNAVISTGGGMAINKLGIDYLRQNGLVVYLDTSFEEITKRLKGDTTRPLFQNKLAAKKLFQFRKNLYKQYADIVVKTDKKTIEEITNLIVKKI